MPQYCTRLLATYLKGQGNALLPLHKLLTEELETELTSLKHETDVFPIQLFIMNISKLVFNSPGTKPSCFRSQQTELLMFFSSEPNPQKAICTLCSF